MDLKFLESNGFNWNSLRLSLAEAEPPASSRFRGMR